MRVVLGITGSIAAYKTPYLIRQLLKQGNEVKVVATENAGHFVAFDVLSFFSHNPIIKGDDYFHETSSLHIDLAKWADVLLIAPADYNIIGKASSGIADDILSTLIASFRGPVVFAPAMHDVMWQNPVLQDKVTYLKQKGYYFSGPVEGELYSKDVGIGRLNEIDYIIEDTISAARGAPLNGKKVLLVYGRTEEKIDDVRVITNRSSGKMGVEIARELKRNGAYVIQIVGKTSFEPYRRDRVIEVVSTEEMKSEVEKEVKNADVLIMAAAVSDFKPKKVKSGKIKREENEEITIELEKTHDILKSIAHLKGNRLFVGFALSSDIEKDAPLKLKEKGLELIVANTQNAMESDFSTGFILNKSGKKVEFNNLSKRELSELIVKEILDLGAKKLF